MALNFNVNNMLGIKYYPKDETSMDLDYITRVVKVKNDSCITIQKADGTREKVNPEEFIQDNIAIDPDGIVTIAEFGSSTNVYKILKASIDTYDDLKGGALEINAWNLWTHISNSLDMDDFSDDTLSVTDAISIQKIMALTPLDYEKTNYVVLKSLKGIDNGLGVVLFIFSILFLGAEIVYLIFVCGIKESQVLSIKLYSIFNILKIVTYSLSITSIFLSILYCLMITDIIDMKLP